MKAYYILSAIGRDRPGIVADVSEVIYECGGNIEDSSMSLLRNQFALLLLFSTDSGVNHAGIVFKVCRLLVDRKVNIIDMETRRVLSAESGPPLFEMDIDVDVPRSISEQGLREDLHHLANELVIDLVLRKM